jgi:ribosomal protein S18 acetylase RimI-like enzyme
MTVRPLALPDDLTALEPLLYESFQYPENPDWGVQEDEKENISAELHTLRRVWPLFWAIARVYPRLRDLLRGYVWEEEGHPVGVVLVSPTSLMGGPAWTVGTVAVKPGYRRRGIARRLVEAGLTLARERGGRTVMLDVIAGNTPAYELYRRLGFSRIAHGYELHREPETPLVTGESLAAGYRYQALPRSEWQPRYDLACRVIPDEVQVFRPVDESNYRPPLLVRALLALLDRLSGRSEQGYVATRVAPGDGPDEVVAVTRYNARTRAGGINSINVMLDPAHSELAPYLLSTIVRQVTEKSPGRRIRLGQFNWGQAVVAAALTMGFDLHKEWHEMGLTLEAGIGS